jgi:hypothetical protein
MAAPGTVYNKARLKLAQAAINLGTADVRAVLVTSGYVPNIDTDEFLSIIGANEVTANGAARVALANKALTLDTTNDRAKFDCDDFEFGPASGSPIVARYAVVYVHTGSDATAPLVGYILLDDTAGGTNVSAAVGQKIKVTVHANGLVQV